MTIIVHVNRAHIAANAKDGGNRPVYTVKIPRCKPKYAREVHFTGPCRAVYNGTQLKCGARAWIETAYRVNLIDEMTFEEARKATE